tara:strand:- start:26961 stop:27524 length:564 start_codon:yes stop_codon:yes gene_type:complete
MQGNLRQNIEKIVQLTDEEYEAVQALFYAKKMNKNQFLIKEGESVNDVYFIKTGLLKLIYTDISDKQHIVSFAMEDWWETDLQAFFNTSKATLSLQCIEDTEVLCLPLENYHKMCYEMPKLQIFLIKMSNAGFLASQRRIIALLTTNVKERFEQLIKQYPTLFQRVPKSQLALYLGVSRETLSRLYS